MKIQKSKYQFFMEMHY